MTPLNEFIDCEVLKLDGFDAAILGTITDDPEIITLAYSLRKMIAVLMSRDKMLWDDAYDYIEYNCMDVWLGEGSPLIIDDLNYPSDPDNSH